LAIAGVAIMSGNWRSDAFPMLVAFMAGVLPGLSVILNSELGQRKGVFRSTRANYLVGFATTLIIVLVLQPPFAESVSAIVSSGPLLVFGGGVMGVIVVSAMNLIVPRIPAFSATLLVFSGQSLTGVLLDVFAEGRFDTRKLIGTFVLLMGLAINSLLSPRCADFPCPDRF
ncbi:MAG: DMT family transporter, partial [Rectinemataceae bacterium]|nr:DMT family transporter [Rectinemataceae bacterium]